MFFDEIGMLLSGVRNVATITICNERISENFQKHLRNIWKILEVTGNNQFETTQFDCTIDSAGNFPNFTKNHTCKRFFSHDSKEILS